MEAQFYTFEFIERYLDGNLSKTEQEAFEQALAQDKKLQTAVEEQRITYQAVNLYAHSVEKERVKKVFERKRGGASRRPYLQLAASVALLIAAVSFYFVQTNRYSDDQLTAGYFTAYPDRVTQMSGQSEETIGAAMKAYNAGDYAAALSLFETVPDSSNFAQEVGLYAGICNLQLEDYTTALQDFQEIMDGQGDYAEAAQWYLALSYVGLGNEAEATRLLNKIVADQAYQHTQASALLEDLNSWWR